MTAIRWNHEYPDLVLVAFGSYDYTRQSGGAICAYSLKNPSHPEYMLPTNSGVMAIDVHPKQASLLAAGMYDGSVAVFDLSRKRNRESPLVRSTAKTGKHTDPVWSVEWHEDDVDQNRNFSSVSSDGRVTTWTMLQKELQHTDVIRLELDTSPKSTAAATTAAAAATGATAVVGATVTATAAVAATANTTDPIFGLGAGTCLDFNQHRENVFLIGTEEGNVHQCSRAYTSKFLKTFKVRVLLGKDGGRKRKRECVSVVCVCCVCCVCAWTRQLVVAVPSLNCSCHHVCFSLMFCGLVHSGPKFA